jgi:CheY-like chemotaxis protein
MNKIFGHLKFVYVDDSPENLAMVTHILVSEGAQVLCTTSVDRGVKAAQESDCDVVLMDLQMPGKDGFEATSELRSLDFTKPIIALTAQTIKGIREKCLRRGFDGYMSKPLNRTDFIESIEILLRNKRA